MTSFGGHLPLAYFPRSTAGLVRLRPELGEVAAPPGALTRKGRQSHYKQAQCSAVDRGALIVRLLDNARIAAPAVPDTKEPIRMPIFT